MSRTMSSAKNFSTTLEKPTETSEPNLRPKSNRNRATFWRWFFRDGSTRAGWHRLLNRWCYFHLAVGAVLSWLVPYDLKTAASTVLLPLVGVLVGLSFAWAGNAQSLLQSEEIETLSEYHEG